MITFREEKMSDELTKFYLNGVPFCAVLHRFTGKDKGDPHDHPFTFTTTILKGGYVERVFQLDGTYHDIRREVGDSFKVLASTIHQIIELPNGECWTLIMPETHERVPGFYQFIDGEAHHRFWNEERFVTLQR